MNYEHSSLYWFLIKFVRPREHQFSQQWLPEHTQTLPKSLIYVFIYLFVFAWFKSPVFVYFISFLNVDTVY